MERIQSPKFRTKRNRLTRYSFACGYIEQRETVTGIRTELYQDGCWHVRQFDKHCQRIFWECFPKLTEARKLFDKQPGKLH